MIQPAEEYYKSIVGDTPDNLEQHNCTMAVMIEFAKIHVEAALKEASEKATMKASMQVRPASSTRTCRNYYIDADSILTAYPLNLIK